MIVRFHLVLLIFRQDAIRPTGPITMSHLRSPRMRSASIFPAFLPTSKSPSTAMSKLNLLSYSEIKWLFPSGYHTVSPSFHTNRLPYSASGEAVARIYNLSLSPSSGDAHALTTETVWNAFWLYALLKHHDATGETFTLPHAGDHQGRFTSALDARNAMMVGTGQPLWSHACDDCEKLLFEPPTDGAPPTPTSTLADALSPLLGS